jgi:alpha-L-rhamnosidase
MLPMCYPADHRDHVFIPNWAMWFVLELEEYLARTSDRVFIDAAKNRIYALLAYFAPFENEYGLLEKLESWIFVEWSKSNEFVQDVNFPTNMLYARMLESVSHLYGDKAAAEKAAKIKETVNKLSFDGTFYCDNMVRGKAGKLYPTGNRTESCQYYAFFCGVASRETRLKLWNILLNDFGPQGIKERDWPNFRDDAKWQEIYPANTFIGNYLRLELLCCYGEYEKLTENIKGFFTKMADTTGTLWENETTFASCNHGFASHVLYWMEKLGMISDQ